MSPLCRLALRGFLPLLLCPLAVAAAPLPSPHLRCGLAAPLHGRAALRDLDVGSDTGTGIDLQGSGPCRLAAADLPRTVFRLSWDDQAGRLVAGPLEATLAPGSEPAVVWRAIHSHPDWQRRSAPGGERRPFLLFEQLVELPFGQDVLVQLSDGGFENRHDVFLTARREGGEIVVTGALEPVFRISIGTIEVLETHAVGEREALLFGRGSGGDNGEVWGSVWLAWLGPDGFRVMVEEPYSWSMAEVGERRVDAQFSTVDLEIRFQDLKPGRRDDDPGAWRTVESRAFDLRPLIAQARRLSHPADPSALADAVPAAGAGAATGH